MARETAAHIGEIRSARSISCAILLGFFAQLIFALDLSIILALALYLLAACLFVRSLSAGRGDFYGDSNTVSCAVEVAATRFCGKGRIEWLGILLLLSIAALFRFYRLGSSPFSLFLDEGLTGLNALEIIEGKNAPVWGMTPLDRWRPDWVQTSNVYLHFVTLVLKLFGTGYFGLKMVSVLPALASVLVVYLLFKELAGMQAAFLAAFFTAVSQWHVTISRWGWDAVLLCLLQLIAYCFLARGMKMGKKWHFAASGVFIGLALYTYIAAWIALAIGIIFLGVRLLRERAQRASRLSELSAFLAACLIIFAPLGAHYLKQPKDLTVRLSEISLAKAVVEVNSLVPLWGSVKSHALMFNYAGDRNARHSFPNEPVLDFVTSVFFVLGLAYCIAFWNTSNHLFLLLWFGLGMQGGLLADPETAPHAYRTMMTIPVVCFFAANAFLLFFTVAWRAPVSLRLKNMILVPAGIGLLGYILAANYWTYFVKRPKSLQVWEEEGRDGGLPVRISSQRKDMVILVDPLFLWKTVVANTWFLTYRPGKLFEPAFVPGNFLTAEPKLVLYGNERKLIYLYPPEFTRMIRSLFPQEFHELVTSPGREPIYGTLKVSLGDLRSRLGSVDKEKLADVLGNVALFYQAQLRSDAEAGPRRRLLIDESEAALAAARQLATR